MTNIILVHGTYSSPTGNWLPWLKTELEKINCQVFVPNFPTPKNQSLENWLKVFDDYKQYLNQDTIVIGHSLGAAFLLSVLETINHPIKQAYFVSSFIGFIGNSEYDILNKTFTIKNFDWPKIKQNCKNFCLISSDNDPYVDLSYGQEVAKNLNSELIVLPNAGHINAESGYTHFEFLLEKIKEIL